MPLSHDIVLKNVLKKYKYGIVIPRSRDKIDLNPGIQAYFRRE
jgi:hypothetical protein